MKHGSTVVSALAWAWVVVAAAAYLYQYRDVVSPILRLIGKA